MNNPEGCPLRAAAGEEAQEKLRENRQKGKEGGDVSFNGGCSLGGNIQRCAVVYAQLELLLLSPVLEGSPVSRHLPSDANLVTYKAILSNSG